MPAPGHTNSQRHWSKNVRDVCLSHDSLQLQIAGGAESGEFLYIAGPPKEKTRYKIGRFSINDILIEVNDEVVAGLTLRDLMNRINCAGKKVNFKVVQPGRIRSIWVRCVIVRNLNVNVSFQLVYIC